MRNFLLKAFGWLVLISIISVSILYLGSVGELSLRMFFSGAMIISLTLFVFVPFWIAYKRD